MSPVTVARGTMMDMLSIAREDAAARFDARQHTTESGDSSHVVISPRRQRRADALFVMGGRTEHRPALHTADRRWSAAHCVASDALPKRRRRRIPQSGSLSHHLDTVPSWWWIIRTSLLPACPDCSGSMLGFTVYEWYGQPL